MSFSCFIPGNALGRSFLICAMAFVLASCASVSGPALQPQINGLIVSGRVQMAADKITARESDYGVGNYVLYHLDRALVLQMTGDHEGSIRSLGKARARNEELYTRSVSKEAATWVVNDNMSPYRAPDYERVLMNVFLALNYLQMNDPGEALVEARDLDSKYPVVTGDSSPKNHPSEDNGFARLFSGILYEAAGKGDDLNDALIAYKQALWVYDAYYGGRYVPRVLQAGLLGLAARFNDEALGGYRARFHDVPMPHQGYATIFLFESVGFSPVKVPEVIPVPVDRGFITKIAFPKFMRRIYDLQSSRLILEHPATGVALVDTELGCDIEGLAEKDLASRKSAILAKAVVRPALKYVVERNQKEVVRKHQGDTAAEVFGLLSNFYNLFTEQADLRSWQSLPAQIRVARIDVPPGIYHARLQDMGLRGTLLVSEDQGEVQLQAGQVYFMVRRSLR